MSENILQAGDRMMFSTDLLTEIKEEGNRTIMVQVLKIEENQDGLQIVYLGTA